MLLGLVGVNFKELPNDGTPSKPTVGLVRATEDAVAAGGAIATARGREGSGF